MLEAVACIVMILIAFFLVMAVWTAPVCQCGKQDCGGGCIHD